MGGIFNTVVNFQKFLLLHRSTNYNLQRRMIHQMCSHHFDGTDPFRIFNYLKHFHMACISSGVQNGEATYVFRLFLAGWPQGNVNVLLTPRARMMTDRSEASPGGLTYHDLLQFLLTH